MQAWIVWSMEYFGDKDKKNDVVSVQLRIFAQGWTAARYDEQEVIMFDRLDDILIHYEELMQELNNPSVTEDQNRFRKLMKEQSDLAPIVEAYREYKKAKQDVEDSLALLEEENDEEMRELAKEDL